ncbi:hypothetical protein [Paraburkholderia sp. BL10I2N1]|uniref:hypothetical protein n=1 Tax=Paraburkholderia sp. BL10I2N1 TaxID=1938796 RepID=UPI001061CDCF|nr:hypothetical protein [Paraburkholderia sp. BL10I2N1]TDN70394.1 hypothetical protein B0G77_3867 [Paraburkholderia sp. BL10I2N1]
MGHIDWGVAAGAAMNSGMNVYDQMQQNRLRQLQYNVQNNQYQQTVGLQQDLSQLDPNSPTYNQDVQTAMARHGQPLQAMQYGREGAQATGLNLANTKTQGIMDAGKAAHDFYNSVDSAVSSGDIATARKTLLSQADLQGIKYQLSPDGNSLALMNPNGQPSGQTYDLTHAPTLLAGAGALQNGILRNSLLAADPTLLPQMQTADASMLHGQAALQDSGTRASMAPSEIARNTGAANQSNAEALIAPQRGQMYGAQAGEMEARTGLTNAQTNLEDVNLGTARAAGQLRDQLNALTPEQLASPQGQALVQKYLMVSSPNGMAYARAYGGANTAAARVQAQGNRPKWMADPNNPNTYLDQNGGTVVQMGKNGQMKVTKLGQGMGAPGGKTTPNGVPTAQNAQGQTGYQGSDGQWYGSEQEALATFTPQRQTALPQGGNPPPLPPPGYNPQGGGGAPLPAGMPTQPGLYDNANY